MKKTLTKPDVIALLRKRCAEAGSQRKFAQQHGISPQYVADVLSGNREPGEKILAAIGVHRETRYTVKD